MDVGIHVMFGAEPSQISFLYFLYFVKKCGGYSAVVDPEKKGYAQEWKVKVNLEELLVTQWFFSLRILMTTETGVSYLPPPFTSEQGMF